MANQLNEYTKHQVVRGALATSSQELLSEQSNVYNAAIAVYVAISQLCVKAPANRSLENGAVSSAIGGSLSTLAFMS